jgi:hypothetical protein
MCTVQSQWQIETLDWRKPKDWTQRIHNWNSAHCFRRNVDNGLGLPTFRDTDSRAVDIPQYLVLSASCYSYCCEDELFLLPGTDDWRGDLYGRRSKQWFSRYWLTLVNQGGMLAHTIVRKCVYSEFRWIRNGELLRQLKQASCRRYSIRGRRIKEEAAQSVFRLIIRCNEKVWIPSRLRQQQSGSAHRVLRNSKREG